jgi:Histidine kinase/Domain of unknown function (DUF4118)
MENLLVLLPSRPQSVPVRYGVTTLIMLVCFALQIGVEFQSGMFTFFLLLPGIFLASVLFDRGSGFYATILSTALCYAVLSPSDSWLLPPQYLLPFLLFVLVGLALATISEAMRKALEKAVAAEQSAEVMLYELNHRIRNNLSMIVSILELQKRSQKEQGAKDAFTSAVSRIHIIANAHNHLLPKEGQSLIDMREYLTVGCQNLGDALRDVRPIAVNVNAAQILLRDDRAVSVGLIVNDSSPTPSNTLFLTTVAGRLMSFCVVRATVSWNWSSKTMGWDARRTPKKVWARASCVCSLNSLGLRLDARQQTLDVECRWSSLSAELVTHRKRPRRAWLPRGNRFEAKSLKPDWPIVFAFAWIFCRAALSWIASPSVGSGVGDVRSPNI